MLTPGSEFAGYRVERIIGRGGMGEVYLARHPRLPRSDALKLMSEELSRNEVYRQPLQRGGRSRLPGAARVRRPGLRPRRG